MNLSEGLLSEKTPIALPNRLFFNRNRKSSIINSPAWIKIIVN